MAVPGRSLLILTLVAAVAIAVAALSSIEVGPRGPSLTRRAFSSDVFDVEVSHPTHVRPGEEVEVEVFVRGRSGFMVSAIVLKAYSCSCEPKDAKLIKLLGELVYEESTRPLKPRSELSTTYRFRLPEELDEWLGLIIYVTPVKPGGPMMVHYAEPIMVPIKVEGASRGRPHGGELPLIRE